MAKLIDFSRIKRFLLFDKSVFKEIRDDSNSLVQALIILCLPGAFNLFFYALNVTGYFSDMSPDSLDAIYFSAVNKFFSLCWIVAECLILAFMIHLAARKLGRKTTYISFLGLAGYSSLAFLPIVFLYLPGLNETGILPYMIVYVVGILCRLLLTAFLSASAKEAYGISLIKSVLIVVVSLILLMLLNQLVSSAFPPPKTAIDLHIPLDARSRGGMIIPVYSNISYTSNQHFTATYKNTWGQTITVTGVNATNLDGYFVLPYSPMMRANDPLLGLAILYGYTVPWRNLPESAPQYVPDLKFCGNITVNGERIERGYKNNITIPPRGIIRIDADCAPLGMAEKYSVYLPVEYATRGYGNISSGGILFGNVL